MNNLYRALAPISDAAWSQIEEEASRTLKRHMGARRVTDVKGPQGFNLAAIGTGHTKIIQSPVEGLQVVQREVKALVELRVPFELSRQAIDDVERGSSDSDWDALKEAAKKIAFAEDRAVFEGYEAAGIRGIRQESSNDVIKLPSSVQHYPDVIAKAVSRLKFAGVNGPYVLVLGGEAYTLATGGSDEGYPVLQHINRLVEEEIIWAPAINGGFVLSARGGDFEMDLGQDISIGYISHSETLVHLYLQESFTFRVLTTEASVVLSMPEKK